MEKQGLRDEQHDGEQQPYEQHRVHPPVRGIGESRPEIPGTGEIEASGADQQRRAAGLPGETPLDGCEECDALWLDSLDPSRVARLGPRQSPALESRASAVSLGNKGRDDLELGQRVFHGKFGYGIIAEIEGNKLEIDFEHSGRKRVLDSFVSVA